MSFAQTVDMLTPLMNSLSKIHTQGLIHRDISPANIMILPDGKVKLLDFGAAREVGRAEEKSLSIMLKPGFAPEEQYRSKGNQGPWTDVYALSATMYKMMTGVTPVDAMNRVFSDDLRQIPEINPAILPEQAAVIYKGMAVLQENRYQSIDQLCADCISAASGSSWMNAWQVTGKQPDKKEMKESAVKGDKKPSMVGFVGSFITGLLTLYCILNATSQIIEETSAVLSILLTVVFGVATFFLGRLYYPRIENKKRKPNTLCLVLNIISIVLTVLCAVATYINFTDVWADEGTGAFSAVVTVLSLSLPIFFGYFYYPRLERKKKNKVVKIYVGIAVGIVALLILGIVFTSLTTVSIGDEIIKRNATNVSLSLDMLTNNDVEKLKELKNLEDLRIFECFLDDEDIKIIGELTQLKELSISTNTDVTDISPLANLKELTYLDITNTKVSDISSISGLVKLKTLKINNTDIVDLSVLKNFVELDTLEMDSLEHLDASTIQLPASVYALYCSNNKLESLEFLSTVDALENIIATNNQITDLTPLGKFELYTVELAANEITDLSPLHPESIGTLDVSTNQISDISCLKGIGAYNLDLSYNEITDVSALADNYKIGVVDLSHNQIADIGPLKDCFKIYSLNISFNQIVDISPVATIDNMEIFVARGNQIEDITPLASCVKLVEGGNSIDLRDNRITNVEALSKFTNTTHIYLSNNQITDISPLRDCTALEMLKLNHNQVADASALSGLYNLHILELVGNPIATTDGLGLMGHRNALLGSSTLRVTYNENIDFEALSKVEKLSITVYDVPPRQIEPLRELGIYAFADYSDELDKIEENSDIPEESAQEETDG